MKEDNISSLIAVLEKEYKYHQKLCESAREKKEAIIENKVEDLTGVIEKEEDLINDLNTLENKRTNILKEIAEDFDLNDDTPNYKMLKSELGSKQKVELKNIRKKLLNTIENLQKVNEENKVLLEEAVNLNKFSFELIANSLAPENATYKQDENNKENKVKNIVDQKV